VQVRMYVCVCMHVCVYVHTFQTLLHSLNVSENGFSSVGVEALCTSMRKVHTSLFLLDLSGNNIGVDGARALASLLISPECVLRHLLVGDAGLGDDGACALATALATSQLHSLRCRSNNFTFVGGEAFGRALHQTKTLTSLDLHDNALEDDGVIAIAESLPHSSLRRLDISKNNLNNWGVMQLKRMLKSGVVLRELHVCENEHMSDKVLEDLVATCRIYHIVCGCIDHDVSVPGRPQGY
jgi:Ran GTPase-activating protein (RanGAP) involved in mRNA processing and transport